MSVFYSYTAVARQLGLNPAKLKRWLDYGLVRTQHRALLGDTLARLFSEEEIRSLKEVIQLIDDGTAPQQAFQQVNMQGQEVER